VKRKESNVGNGNNYREERPREEKRETEKVG
jgi:hypothetical protein